MAHQKVRAELSIVYEPAGEGWLTATIPAVPGTISTGSDRDNARDNVLDALATTLSIEPGELSTEAEVERLSIALATGRGIARDR